MPCSIQNSRMAASVWLRVKPSAAFGWEKYVGLKSRPRRLAWPSRSSFEMARLDAVAVDEPAAVLQIGRVQVEAMAPGNEAERLFNIAAELGDGAGLAGIIARGLNAAAGEFRPGVFESADIVALPAV